jgi:FkbM family methyltransferase
MAQMKNIVYKILDLLLLGKGIRTHISGFSLRLPTRYYKYFEHDYELNNINFLNNYLTKGMTVIDVGAHLGALSMIMAEKVGPTGKIISFEPTPSTFLLLQKTVSINGQSAVVIPVRKAVSDKPGKAQFYVMGAEANNANSLSNNGDTQHKGVPVDIDLTSIDLVKKEYQLSAIDLVKIDAEGAELSVLKGAIEVIKKDKPKIILALHPASIIQFGDTLLGIWQFIEENGYSVYLKNDKIDKGFFIKQIDLFDVFLLPGN